MRKLIPLLILLALPATANAASQLVRSSAPVAVPAATVKAKPAAIIAVPQPKAVAPPCIRRGTDDCNDSTK